MKDATDRDAKIVELYDQNWTQQQIADVCDLSQTGVGDILRRTGARMRVRTPKYPFNEHAFDAPLTEEAIYWLGFLMADGSVGKRRRTRELTLALAERDLKHLEKFQSFLETTRPIYHGITKSGYNNNKPVRYCSLRVSSCHMVERLCELGVTPRKSATARPPESLAMNPTFWRGMMDGDGHVGIWRFTSKSLNPQQRAGLSFCGSRWCVEGFQRFCVSLTQTTALPKRCKKSPRTWQFALASRNARCVLEKLYPPDCVALQRKHEKARLCIGLNLERQRSAYRTLRGVPKAA